MTEPTEDRTTVSTETAGEQRLLNEAILRTMRQPLVVLDGALVVDTANRAFCELFKVTIGEATGQKIYDLGNGQWNIPKLRTILDDILSDDADVTDFSVEHEFPDLGRRIMILDAHRMTREGRGDQILLAIEDVTERELARRALEDQKIYIEKIVDSSHDALLVLDLDLKVRTANETFYRSFEVDPAQTEGRLVYELGNGQWDIPELRRLLQNVLPDNNAFDDFEIAHDFEGIGRRLMRLNARRVDHIQLILLAIEDRTAAVKAKAALLRSEERYRGLFDSIDQGFCVIEMIYDADGRPIDYRFLEVNAAFERQAGLRDVIGRTMRELEPAHEVHWFEVYGRIARTGEPERFELPAEKLDKYFEVNAFRVATPEARQVGVLFNDISVRKRAEQHQDLLIAELDHRVKNVLAVVQSVARQSLRTVGEAGRDAADELVGRLSALARSHSLLANSRWEGASFRDLMESAVAGHLSEDPDRVHLGGPDIRITPKAAQTLSLALHELVTNATKYGALSRRKGCVTAEWHVRGTGDDARLMFQWHERGGPPIEQSPDRKGFGSRMIEQVLTYELGGTVSLDFAREGLEAVFVLPLETIRAKPDHPRRSGSQNRSPLSGDTTVLRGKRILIVEDEHLVAQETAEALQGAGCSVSGPMPDLDRALQSAEAEEIDAAVLDVNLNGERVWPVAAALRSRDIPFVFATGYSGIVEPPQTFRSVPWIEKPMQPEQLLSVLAGLFETEVRSEPVVNQAVS